MPLPIRKKLAEEKELNPIAPQTQPMDQQREIEFKHFAKGVRYKIASQGSIGIGTLLGIILLAALYITLPLALCYLLVGIIGAALGIILSIPAILAAGYLLTSLAACSLIIPLLPAATAALPTALVALVTIAVTAIVMTIIDLFINIPTRSESMSNAKKPEESNEQYTSWSALIRYSLGRSRDGIVYFMIPAVLIALACGLPPVAASLHFAGGILPGLISFSAISIGCIVKSLHQASCTAANATTYIFNDIKLMIDQSRSDDNKLMIDQSDSDDNEPMIDQSDADDNEPMIDQSDSAYQYQPEKDAETIEHNTLKAPLVLLIAALALVVVTFLAGGILPAVWSLLCVLVLTVLSVFSSAYLVLPAVYTIACVGICSLVLPLLPATTTLLGSLATLTTGLAITFAAMMVLDIIVDHCVKLFYMPGAPSDELARFSVINTCWSFLLVALPIAIICWSCGLPTLLIGSSMLSSILPLSTISIICLTSTFLCKNSIVLAMRGYADEQKTTWHYHTAKGKKDVGSGAPPKRVIPTIYRSAQQIAEEKGIGRKIGMGF